MTREVDNEVEALPPVAISKKLILVNSISSVGTRILGMTVFAGVIGYLTQVIPETELELLPLTESVAAMLPLVQMLFTAGIARHAMAAYAGGNRNGVTEVVSSIFPPLAVGAILLLAVGSTFLVFAPGLLDIPSAQAWQLQWMFSMVFGNAVVGMLLAPFSVGVFIKQRFVTTSMIEIAGTLLRIGILLGAFQLLTPHVYWVVAAQVAGQLLVLVMTVMVSIRLVPALRFKARLFRWSVAKEVLQFGSWSTVGQLGATIRQAADPPLLHYFATPTAVNEFYLGAIVDRMIRTVMIIGGNTTLPALTAIHVSGSTQRLRNAFVKGGRLTTWIALLMALPIVVFRETLWNLYLKSGLSDHPHVPTVAVLLMFTYLFYYPSSMLIRIVHAQGNVGTLTRLTLMGQLLNLGLTVIFVGPLELGSRGSAMATLLATIATQLFLVWPLATRMLGVTWREFLLHVVARGCLPFIACTFVGEILIRSVSDGVAIVAGIAALVGCLYFGLVWLCATVYERELIRQSWRSVVRR